MEIRSLRPFGFDQTNTDYGDPEAGIRVDNHTGHGDGPSLAPRWPTIGLYEGLHALTRGFGCWRATFGHNGARTAMGEDSDLLVSTKQIQIMATRRRGISVDIHAGTVMAPRWPTIGLCEGSSH